MDRRINIKNKERVSKNGNTLEISDIVNHWLFKLSSLFISGVIFFSVFNSVKITLQKLEILKQAEQEVEELRLTNLHLSISIQDMSTDKYLEKEARDRLNFGGEGEIVFVIPTNVLKLGKEKVQSIVNEDESSISKGGNNVDEWISFMISGV